jgi:uncharacterized protein with ATP-grasp and redox domains
MIEYSQSPPVLGRRMHRLIREILDNPDPYHRVKVEYNRMMLSMYPQFESMVISNGQGNLEGLIDVPHSSIYFFLVTKCDYIANHVGASTGEFIVKKGKP